MSSACPERALPSRSPECRLHALALPLLAVACAQLLACGEPVAGEIGPLPNPVSPIEDPVEEPEKPFDISWGGCSIPTRADPIEADCATVEPPVIRGSDSGETMAVAVYRLPATQQPATTQLWLLNGGPGAAGFVLAEQAVQITERLEGVDVYLIDPRGTGESGQIDCPNAWMTSQSMHEFMEKCSAEIRDQMGDRVDGLTTTEVANDIREIIESTRAEGQKIFVYGVSYGSYLAHRLVQLPETRVDGIITDGNCIGTLCSFDTPQAFRVDEAVGHVTDVCRDTPDCAARMGEEPWTFVTETLDLLANGHCSQSAISQWATADLAASVGAYWPAGLMPTFYRIRRCSPEDVVVLDTLETKLVELRGYNPVRTPFGPLPAPSLEREGSGALTYHVGASELIPRPAPPPSVLEERAADFVFRPNPWALDVTYYDLWEVYPRDEYVDGWAKRDVPWLMVQGTFDFQTEYSLAERAVPFLENPSLQLVRIDGGGHGAAFASACSYNILEAFMGAPRAQVDTACLAEVKQASLTLHEHYLQHFFGTSDAWGGPLGP